jgi:hypothetical protein
MHVCMCVCVCVPDASLAVVREGTLEVQNEWSQLFFRAAKCCVVLCGVV